MDAHEGGRKGPSLGPQRRPFFHALAAAAAGKRAATCARAGVRHDQTQAIKFEHGPFSPTNTIFNIALFIMLAEQDIDDIDSVILLTIHELDFDKVSGKPLRDAPGGGRRPRTNSPNYAMRPSRIAIPMRCRSIGLSATLTPIGCFLLPPTSTSPHDSLSTSRRA